MIISIVRFEPEGVSPEEIRNGFTSSTTEFVAIPDLIRKICCYDSARNLCTIVYLWKSREAAKRWFADHANIRKFREHFHCLAEFDHHDVITVIDDPAVQGARIGV